MSGLKNYNYFTFLFGPFLLSCTIPFFPFYVGFHKTRNINAYFRGSLELDELWMDMWQRWDDLLATKTAEDTAQPERDEEKVHIGKKLMVPVTKRKKADSGSTIQVEDGPTTNISKFESALASPSNVYFSHIYQNSLSVRGASVG